MVVAHKSSSEEIGILRKIFQKFDKKRDGSIGFEDFCSALAEFGHSEQDLKEMFEAVVSEIQVAYWNLSRKSCFTHPLSLGLGWFGKDSLHRVFGCNH